MSKLVKCLLLAVIAVSFSGVNFASAGDLERTRDRKKDGSCQRYSIEHDSRAVIAANGTKKQDRKRDGSCQSYTVQEDEGMTLAAGKKRAQNRDKSC
jgi:hypothetical protein